MSEKKLLLIDDDPAVLSLLGRTLGVRGLRCRTESDYAGAEAALARDGYAAVVCDLMLGELSCLGLLKAHRAAHPEVPFLVMTGYGDLETTVEVMQAGAFDVLPKPLDLGQVSNVVARALSARPGPGRPAETRAAPAGLIGRSPAMVELFKTIARLAKSDAPLLIEGETGSGKELVARAVHMYGPRAARRFVAVNCAALPPAIIESELFGHRRGAFTGALSDRPGLFREAEGGTILLDEIGELDPSLQAKLLRALQEKKVRAIGDDAEIPVDVRVVAATLRPLEGAIGQGRFRQDLFFRISTLRARLPPLRERAADLELLARAHLAELSGRLRRNLDLTEDGLEALRAHDWPGNVRELFHALDRAASLTLDGRLTAEDFGRLAGRRDGPRAGPLRTLAQVEREHILAILHALEGNKKRAAETLRIDRKTLRRKLKIYAMGAGR